MCTKLQIFNKDKHDRKLQINEIRADDIYNKNLKKNFINFINVSFNADKENKYIEKCFDIALKLIQKDRKIQLINGPINKKNFLANKFVGITEYLAKKCKVKNNSEVMLIYNKYLAVAPVTTHLDLKSVSKRLNKIHIFINDFSATIFFHLNLK